MSIRKERAARRNLLWLTEHFDADPTGAKACSKG